MLPEYELQDLWFLHERFAWKYETERARTNPADALRYE